MSDKVAYPVFGTCGVLAGLGVYEVFRCTKSDHTFVEQMKLDYGTIKGRITGLWKMNTEITANDLFPARIGPDGKPLRTLIIDLEDTIMTDEWDAVNGERHIRRPGLDKMLMYLSSMYDIYIITNMDANYGMTLMPDIDKNHVCSGYLYSDSMKLRKGTRVKDISYFSRDPQRVIILDDNINANEQKENVMVVKPFKNVKKVKDTTLLDLIPVLEDIYLNDVEDVREYIRQLDGEDAVTGFRKLQAHREEEAKEERQKAFLQQINIFKPEENETADASLTLLSDPELEGFAPALASNNMQQMVDANAGAFSAPKMSKSDHLKYIPVEINGEKPEGFTTYWQREYLKKKEAMLEQQQRMMEMQTLAMQELKAEE